MRCPQGSVFDVALDINHRSPTYGQWFGAKLTDENHKQLWIPPGYAHGFVVLSDTALFEYKCTDYYHPGDEIGVRWNDEVANIDWPVKNPAVSDRDSSLPRLEELSL